MTDFDQALRGRLLDTVTARIIAAAEELTDLDAAIGDGDHGINMKRGMEAVIDAREAIVALAPGEALQLAGKQLVMKVGGASGPLFGTLALQLGKSWPSEPTPAGLHAALAAALAAVMARGRSEPGQKTLLDVLAPVTDAVGRDAPLADIAAIAAQAADATIPLRAQRGRASFLGERSVGHMDPGARSLALIVTAIVDVLEGRA